MKEIGDWIEETYLNFAVQENKDPRRSANNFLQREKDEFPRMSVS